jgi:hypothetical protein
MIFEGFTIPKNLVSTKVLKKLTLSGLFIGAATLSIMTLSINDTQHNTA